MAGRCQAASSVSKINREARLMGIMLGAYASASTAEAFQWVAHFPFPMACSGLKYLGDTSLGKPRDSFGE